MNSSLLLFRLRSNLHATPRHSASSASLLVIVEIDFSHGIRIHYPRGNIGAAVVPRRISDGWAAMADLMQGNMEGCFAHNKAPLKKVMAMHRANRDVPVEYQCSSCTSPRTGPATHSPLSTCLTWLQLANGPTAIGEFLL